MATIAPFSAESRPSFRGAFTGPLAMDTDIGDCDVLDMRGLTDAAILIPTGVTAITFWACATEGGTYREVYSNAAALATLTVVADRWYTFPAAVIPHAFVKIVPNADGLATIVAKT